MEIIAVYDYSNVVDIDETLSTWKEILERYGYAPIGSSAIRAQFHSNGKYSSAIAAYTSTWCYCF